MAYDPIASIHTHGCTAPPSPLYPPEELPDPLHIPMLNNTVAPWGLDSPHLTDTSSVITV